MGASRRRTEDDEIPAVGHLDDELAEQTLQVIVGRRALGLRAASRRLRDAAGANRLRGSVRFVEDAREDREMGGAGTTIRCGARAEIGGAGGADDWIGVHAAAG